MVVLLCYFILFTSVFTVTYSIRNFHEHVQSNFGKKNCTVKCGNLELPFPFYLNGSNPCGFSLSDAFSLSCVNSSALFLNMASESYKVLHFFSDGVLLDFPNTSTCRQYNDLRSFPFSGNQYFGISTDNFVDLYDCEDSSLCRPDCERTYLMPSCGRQTGSYPSCCYPLSDRSSWRVKDGSFSDFSKFGCRGFSSWVVLPGNGNGKRGVKLEWAVPGNSTEGVCATNADILNASSVVSGVRCQCRNGFVGDGFTSGVGCLKSCFKDGKEFHGDDCYPKNHARRKTTILTGVLAAVFALLSLVALFYFLKWRPMKTSKYISDQNHCPNSTNQKPARSRIFTYNELEESTKGFDDGRKIVDGIYAGILTNQSHVAVQKVNCASERELIAILYRVEALSTVFHKNMAQILGWSIDSGFSPLVVYEYPENETLESHLRKVRYQQVPFDWYKRLNIAAELASLLAILQHKYSPPIFHNNLQTGCIFLDMDFSVKLAGFEMHKAEYNEFSDVCNFGVILMQIITGNTTMDCSTSALQKIKNGKLEEILDPSLYYHEQPVFRKDEIDIIADLATRCLLFGGDGKLGMVDVAKELVHITKDSVDGSGRRGPGLEETFSNSSLLQMISMSPDSIYVPT